MKTLTHAAHGVAATDRPVPHNLEAERSVLGSCLLDPKVIDDVVVAGLSPDDFFRSTYAEIFRAITAMNGAGDDVDAVTLADHLIRRGTFEKLGGDEMLREIVEAVPHAANACYYAGIVRERAAGRRIIEVCTDLLRRCYSNQFTASDLVCEAQDRVLALAEREAGDSAISYTDLMGEVMARMAVREQDQTTGISCGFPDIDAVTCGFRPGELTILAARPGMGKTSMALDLAQNVARGGQQALVFSIEMGREALGDRILTGDALVDSDRFRAAWAMNDAEKRRIYQAANNLSQLPVHVDFSPARSVPQIAAVARRHQRRHGLGLVVVDYIQLVKGTRQDGAPREQVVAEISGGLKHLARSLSVPVMALAQLNREVEKRSDKTPMLSDLRESGAIEQDADVVFLLYRPEYYDANDRPGTAELIVAKNRNGRTGTVTLAFQAQYTRFDSIARVDDAACDAAAPF